MTFKFPLVNLYVVPPKGGGSVVDMMENRTYNQAVDGFFKQVRSYQFLSRRLQYIDSYVCKQVPGQPSAMCLQLAVRSSTSYMPPSAFIYCKRYDANNSSKGRLLFGYQGWRFNVNTEDSHSVEFYKHDRLLIISEIQRICNVTLDLHRP